MLRKLKDNQSEVVRRRVASDVGEVEIASDEYQPLQNGVFGNFCIPCGAKSDVAHVKGIMSTTDDDPSRTARHVGIDEETHGLSRKESMLFPLHQPGREMQCRPDVVVGHPVFAGYVIEAHAAGKRTGQNGHRNTGAPDDRLAMANPRINRDAICSNVFHTCIRA